MLKDNREILPCSFTGPDICDVCRQVPFSSAVTLPFIIQLFPTVSIEQCPASAKSEKDSERTETGWLTLTGGCFETILDGLVVMPQPPCLLPFDPTYRLLTQPLSFPTVILFYCPSTIRAYSGTDDCYSTTSPVQLYYTPGSGICPWTIGIIVCVF